MSKISRFTSKAVQLAKYAVGERDEVAAPEAGGGFAKYAVVSLHCLRVYLEKSYREALDLLNLSWMRRTTTGRELNELTTQSNTAASGMYAPEAAPMHEQKCSLRSASGSLLR